MTIQTNEMDQSEMMINIIREAMDYVIRTQDAIDECRAFELLTDLLHVKDYLEERSLELTEG